VIENKAIISLIRVMNQVFEAEESGEMPQKWGIVVLCDAGFFAHSVVVAGDCPAFRGTP